MAIIDSGIYYKHPALGGCFGPGCKVEFGYGKKMKDDISSRNTFVRFRWRSVWCIKLDSNA